MYGIEKSRMQNISTVDVCLKNYGISVSEPFSNIRNDMEERFVNPLTGRAMARGQMIWLMSKGQVILSNEPWKAQQVLKFRFPRQTEMQISLPVYEYEFDDKPTKIQDSKSGLTFDSNRRLLMTTRAIASCHVILRP
jgi:hypothetical protein